MKKLWQSVQVFISGRRLLYTMISLQTFGGIIISTVAPADRSLALAICAICLAASLLALWVPDIYLPFYPGEQMVRWIIFIGCLLVGALYAYLKPPWEDEKNILTAARVLIRLGINGFFVSYGKINWMDSQHPPVMILLYGGWLKLFGGGLYTLRLFAVITAAITVQIGAEISKKLQPASTGLTAALILTTMPALWRVGATALLDITIAGIITLALLLVLRLEENGHWQTALAAGLLLGIGLLCKYTTALFFVVLAGWYLISPDLRRHTSSLILLSAAAFALLGGWLFAANRLQVLQQQTSTLQHYTGMVATTEFGRLFVLRTLIFSLPAALGITTLPLIAKGLAIFATKNQLPQRRVILWAGAVILPVLLTLPDFRYLLASFPALAIMAEAGLQSEPSASIRIRAQIILWVGCTATLLLLEVISTAQAVPLIK